MSIVRASAPLMALTTVLFFAPAVARAQDERVQVSFAPAVATMGGDATLALGGTFGYRFAERLWFEGDLTWIDAAGGFPNRTIEFESRGANASDLQNVARAARMFGGGFPGTIGLPILPNVPGIGLRATADGSTMVGTLGLRYELPVQTDRFRPYVAGGLGIDHTSQDVRIDATAFNQSFFRTFSDTGAAFNAGAGASVRLAGQLRADIDARYFRLSRDRNVMRLGGGVSFRF